MLVDRPEFRESLRRMVAQRARDDESPEDLMQDVVVHASKVESDFPDETWKWYLRNCWFFLRGYLRRQRKRARLEEPLSGPSFSTQCDSPDEGEDEMEEVGSDDSFYSIVGAHDLIQVLSVRLKRERDVLVLLDFAQGSTVTDIAEERPHLTRQTVTDIRLRLCSMLLQLGFQPPAGKHPNKLFRRKQPQNAFY